MVFPWFSHGLRGVVDLARIPDRSAGGGGRGALQPPLPDLCAAVSAGAGLTAIQSSGVWIAGGVMIVLIQIHPTTFGTQYQYIYIYVYIYIILL